MKLNLKYRISLLLFGLILAFWAPPAKAEPRQIETTLSPGYRMVSTQGNPARAREYSLLDSSGGGEMDMKVLFPRHRLRLDGFYLNESEYRLGGEVDYNGLLRLQLGTESLWHNLDHLAFSPPQRADAFKPNDSETAWVKFSDQQPGKDYALEVEQHRAAVRGKVRNFPAHINLGYWRLERSGNKQLTFVSEGTSGSGGSCNQCHVQSKGQPIDQVTEEVKLGLDAHLGRTDVILEGMIREFRNHEASADDFFGELRSQNQGVTLREAGIYQHDSTPDSRLLSSTLKLHSSLTGGVVGAAEFTLGKRENRSDVSDVQGIESETDFYKTAGDLTLIPSARWTLNFQYRFLDLDNTNSDRLQVAGGSDALNVRENLDLTQAVYGARLSYRPSRRLTLQGEFRRRDVHRAHTGEAVDAEFFPELIIDPNWELPSDEVIHSYRFTARSRPLGRSNFKLNGWYQYQTSNDPAYGTSAQRGHEAFAGLTYAPTATWGLTGNLRLLRQANNRHRLEQFGSTTGNLLSIDLDRKDESQQVSAGVWANPISGLALNFHYGFLRKKTIQDLLFGRDPLRKKTIQDLLFGRDPEGVNVLAEDADYSQTVHSASAGANWQINQRLSALCEALYIRSRAELEPEFSVQDLSFFGFPDPVDVDAEGINDLSELDIRQWGIRLGLRWVLEEAWSCSLNYSYDDYQDLNSGTFDGTAQTYMFNVARSW